MKPVFKEYNQGEILMFPESFDAHIPENHVVRLISKVVDKLDIEDLIRSYKGGGTSSYHPRMLLKVLFYAYFNNIYSSRKIEKALRENIYFMWLSGKQYPDHRTINNFRSKRLKGHINKLFKEIVVMLNQLGVVDLKEVIYTDGTKIEANSNRYRFVWRKRVENDRKKLLTKVKVVIKEIESQIKEESQIENNEFYDTDVLNSEVIEEKVSELNKQIEEEKLNARDKKKLKKRLKKIEKEELERLKKYEESIEKFGERRNSYSKTDEDATFMRMKEDRLSNRELKPGYNLQISTQGQVILHYSIHQDRADYLTYRDHLEGYKRQYGFYPSKVVADAGYGSEQNYDYLTGKGIKYYVKYPGYYKSRKPKELGRIDNIDNWYYNQDGDYYVCPMGKKLYRKSRYKQRQHNYEKEITVYESTDCEGCPIKGVCHKKMGKSGSRRQIHINHKLRRYKSLVKENLDSASGQYYIKQRSIEPESVFGQIKWNKSFRRFVLRGLSKVNIEFGLIAISHNLSKLWRWLTDKVCPKMELNLILSRI